MYGMQQGSYVRPTYTSEVSYAEQIFLACFCKLCWKVCFCLRTKLKQSIYCMPCTPPSCKQAADDMTMLDHYEPLSSVRCTSQFVSDLQFPELAGGMANRSMQAPFSQGPAPHSPVGPPGLMAAGPMHDSSFMHPVMGAGGQFVPIPMQVSTLPAHHHTWQGCML